MNLQKALDNKSFDLGVPSSRRGFSSSISSAFPQKDTQTFQEPSKDIDMDHTQLSFLEDQIKRLSHELYKYQKKYPRHEDDREDVEKESESEFLDFHLPPWLVKSKYCSPLFSAYESKIACLKQKFSGFSTDFEALATRTKTISEENAYLHEQILLLTNPDSPYFGLAEHTPFDGKRFAVLQEENELLQRENQLLNDVVLHHQQESGRNNFEDLQHEYNQLFSKYQDMKTRLSESEVSPPPDTSRQEMLIATLYEERDNLLEALREKSCELSALTTTLSTVQKEKTTFETRISSLTCDYDNVVQDRNDTLVVVDGLEKVNQTQEQKIIALEKNICRLNDEVLDSLRVSEESSLALKGHQAKLVKLREKHESEISSLREGFQRESGIREQQLRLELADLEQQNNDLLAQKADYKVDIERLLREKTVLENTTSQKKNTERQELERLQQNVNELNLEIKSLTKQNKNSEVSSSFALEKHRTQNLALEHDVTSLEEKIVKIKQQNSDLSLLIRDLRAENLKLTCKLNELERQNQDVSEMKEKLQAHFTQHISLIQDNSTQQIASLKQEFTSQREKYEERSRMEHTLISSQHALRQKWKDEMRNTTHRFELAIEEMKEENKQLRIRVVELDDKLADSQAREKTFANTLLEDKNEIDLLYSKLHRQ